MAVLTSVAVKIFSFFPGAPVISDLMSLIGSEVAVAMEKIEVKAASI